MFSVSSIALTCSHCFANVDPAPTESICFGSPMPRTSISLLAAHAKMTPCSRFDAMPISSQINTSTAGAVSCSIALTKLAAVRTCTPVAAPKFCAANPAVEIPKTFNPLASHT